VFCRRSGRRLARQYNPAWRRDGWWLDGKGARGAWRRLGDWHELQWSGTAHRLCAARWAAVHGIDTMGQAWLNRWWDLLPPDWFPRGPPSRALRWWVARFGVTSWDLFVDAARCGHLTVVRCIALQPPPNAFACARSARFAARRAKRADVLAWLDRRFCLGRRVDSRPAALLSRALASPRARTAALAGVLVAGLAVTMGTRVRARAVGGLVAPPALGGMLMLVTLALTRWRCAST
jgi:hypothetical protein